MTGAGRGLGRGIALALAEAGARVVVTDLDAPVETAELVEAAGRPALALAADVTDREAVAGAMARAAERFGSLDGLVANRHDELPVDIEVVDYMRNSQVLDAGRTGSAVPNPATTGAGLRAIAVARPQVSGTDQEQTVDIPAVYVTLRDKGNGGTIGTYLATPWIRGSSLDPQVVTVDGTDYDLQLRFARTYKPYRIELLEFRHDKYVGTETPKNFSSLVRLIDESKGVDRTVSIWMNNPLRYAGETFYQSSFEPGKNLTILQVVRNDGWMIPYLSCMFVAVGMTVHMGTKLFEFLRRRVRS